MHQNFYASMLRTSMMDNEKIMALINDAPVTDHTIRPATLYLSIYIDGYVITLFDTASEIPIFHGCIDMMDPNENLQESLREAGVLKHAPNPGKYGLEAEREVNAGLLQVVCLALSAACINEFQRHMQHVELGNLEEAPPIMGKFDVPLLAELLDQPLLDSGIPDPHEVDVFNLIDNVDINLN